MTAGVAQGGHATHASHHSPDAIALQPADPTWLTESGWWIVMIMAMMFPMLIPPIRLTAACSLWRRRHRAIVGFLLGYLATWLMFGLIGLALIYQVQQHISFQTPEMAAVVFAIALLWQLTATKRRSLLACHRTRPLAPSGWRADRDCLRYGWMIGSWCLVSCGLLMLGCMLAGHGLPAMAGVTAVGCVERNQRRPNQLLICSIIAAVALACLILPR